LAAAQNESVFGAQPSFQGLVLLFRGFPNKDRRFHERHYSLSHTTCLDDALENASEEALTYVSAATPALDAEVAYDAGQLRPEG
jgi:hypothetical protein